MIVNHKVGQRAWHRTFGWGTIVTPPVHTGKCLFNSEYRHVQVYHAGKGWVDYIGENGGCIKTIHIPVNELFAEEQKDDIQGLHMMMIKIIS